ncbi:MAG: competence protein competence protein ComFC [Parcubacteria group bacterium]|nr:competence protein competence protein ComFC [Parcubacteria group bacterium]
MKTIIDLIFPPRESELRVREYTKNDVLALLCPTVLNDTSTERSASKPLMALLPYKHETVQACVIEAKFHNNAQATALLAHVLHEYLFDFITETKEFFQEKIIFVSIPLSRSRKRERGYNQAEQIATHALVGLEEYIALDPGLLVRTRDTVPQTTLDGGARRQNIIGAFATTRPCNPAHTYIVFDDVVTTGATLHAAAETLTKAGAKHIITLALAH